MKTLIYSWCVYPLLFCLAKFLGAWSGKVRETLKLRSWKHFLSLRFNAGRPIEYWVHVASHGELEYAIPILQELGRRGKQALITYYSISAKRPVEELPQKMANVSLVVPLPHDGLGLMREFVALAKKQGVKHLLLLKYELWPGLLWECNAQGIRVVLVDALRPGWFHRKLLHKIDRILAGYSSEIESIRHGAAEVVGDTRVERVLQRMAESAGTISNAVPRELIEEVSRRPVLVCGSMWPADTAVLLKAMQSLRSRGMAVPDLFWVPHELDPSEARKVAGRLERAGYRVYGIGWNGAVRTGQLPGAPAAVIVMKKGILAELYRLGQAAYVGGGFGDGVHSVWEPALAGAKVACGPKTERSPESRQLEGQEILTQITSPDELAEWLAGRLDRPRWERTDVEPLALPHRGAAKRIVDVCEGGA